MAAFKYVVQDKSGKAIRGVMEAEERSALLNFFRENAYHVISLDAASDLELSLYRLVNRFSGVSRTSVIFFTRQLATLARSGLPLALALDSLAVQERNQKFRAVIESVKNDIEKGRPFSEALARYPHLFPGLYIGMIEAGEAAGILDEVLERLAHLGLQEMEIKTKLQAALTYPVILVAVAVFVIGFVLVGAIPKFLDIFKASQASLPLPTMILLTVSAALRRFWFVLLIAAGAGIYGVYRYRASPQGRLVLDRLLLRLPIFSEVYLKVTAARLTRTISALTKTGIPLVRALDIARGVATNMVIVNAVYQIRQGVTQGKNLTELFQKSGIFPPMVVQMVSVGETTGKLDEMLAEVASFYELELEYFLRRLTSSLEPILLLLMGSMVGFIALAVLMPVFNLVKVFRQG